MDPRDSITVHGHCVISADPTHSRVRILQPLDLVGMVELKHRCPLCMRGLQQLAEIPDLSQLTILI